MHTHPYLISLIPLLALVSSAPVRRQGSTCPSFALQGYAAFQISDGTAGDAQTQANAVFVDPFAGCDLSTVDAISLSNVQTMREAAETAETAQFDPAIDAASGDTATALQNGKIKNKVLKLTGEIQALAIQLAQGKDTQSDIDAEQTKLDSNIKLDTAATGQASQGITGGTANSTSTKRSFDIQPRKQKDHEKAAAACTATAGSTSVNASTADSAFTSTNGNVTSIEGSDNLALRSIQRLRRHHKANKNGAAVACAHAAVGDSSSNITIIDDTGSANDTSSTATVGSDVQANSTASINDTSINATIDSSIEASTA